MKGRHSIEIRNNRSVFKFNLEYNISVIKGDSATGKTTLIDRYQSIKGLARAAE